MYALLRMLVLVGHIYTMIMNTAEKRLRMRQPYL
jgi:hypothetical protein